MRSGNITTVAGRRSVVSTGPERVPLERGADQKSYFEEPERWLETMHTFGDPAASAKLTRWSCAGESGKVTDHFFPGEMIRLFVEFECRVSVRAASAAFAIRNKTGQIIHGKHQYQIDSATRIGLDPTFFLQCEFAFTCHLAFGEYAVEFGLIDIFAQTKEFPNDNSKTGADESIEILCHPRPVGRFSIVCETIDPIRRTAILELSTWDARTLFRTYKAQV
jgi:hypothetical protein